MSEWQPISTDDMPDHIWAQTHTVTNRHGRWSVVDLNAYAPASKYVRADLVDELVRALEEAKEDIDRYIWHEYPTDHPVHERYRARDFAANPARIALARYRGGITSDE